MQKQIFRLLVLALLAGTAQAETATEMLSKYQNQAVQQLGAFQASANRGAAFYTQKFGVSETMPSCSSCHTDSPANEGRHVVTDKRIKPLSPQVNSARLSKLSKVEKWFRRNCSEVVGRECSAAEKADFIAFLTQGG